MYLKKKSPLTPFIWHEIQKMEESGITDILYRRHKVYEPNCKSMKANSLGIEKIAPLFVLFSFGVTISIIILFIECIFPNGFSNSTLEHDTILPGASDKKELLLKKIEVLRNELNIQEDFSLAKVDCIFHSKVLVLLEECTNLLLVDDMN